MIDTKNKPTPKRRNTVMFLLIAIFLKENVGTLLINSRDTKTIKYGVIILKLNKFEKFDSSNIKGNKIKQPPAGDGTP